MGGPVRPPLVDLTPDETDRLRVLIDAQGPSSPTGTGSRPTHSIWCPKTLAPLDLGLVDLEWEVDMGGSLLVSLLAAPSVPQRLDVRWQRFQGNAWAAFTTVDLSDPSFTRLEGVYVIWRSSDRRVVRVGQGRIAERLAAHRADLQIRAHELSGPLLATWAEVPRLYRDGIERYLADSYGPFVEADVLAAVPIEVNLPE
jgi:hypothetical protein